MARPTSFLLRRDQGRPAQASRVIRRLAISGLTADGVELGGPGQDGAGNVERFGLEVFGVAGFASRPTGNSEAVVATVGGRGGHQVVIAVRNPDAARAIGADQLAGDEVMVYTPTTYLKITAAGEILIARKDGLLERVTTESHVHGPGIYVATAPVVGVSGPALVNPGTPSPAVGTPATAGFGISPVLKAQGKP